MLTVESLMTRDVLTVTPQTPLIDAVSILTNKSFNGVPVVDDNKKLIGLLTEHSMLSQKSYIHLLTLMKLLGRIDFYKKDSSPIKEDLKKILALKVSDLMNINPVTAFPQMSIDEVSKILADPRNNPIPVISPDGKLVGILALSDLTRLYGVSLPVTQQREVDANIDKFVSHFEKQFVLVSRNRIHGWLITAIIFVLLGFAISFLLIIRINF